LVNIQAIKGKENKVIYLPILTNKNLTCTVLYKRKPVSLSPCPYNKGSILKAIINGNKIAVLEAIKR